MNDGWTTEQGEEFDEELKHEVGNLHTSKQFAESFFRNGCFRFWKELLYYYEHNTEHEYHFEPIETEDGFVGPGVGNFPDKQLIEIACYIKTGKNFLTGEPIWKIHRKTFAYADLLRMPK